MLKLGVRLGFVSISLQTQCVAFLIMTSRCIRL